MGLDQLHAYGPELTSARAARTLVRPVLEALPRAVADDALLLVSELVTNGLVHARTEIELHLRTHGDRLYISVRDASPRPLQLKGSGRLDPGGRGLHIVDALADRWGVQQDRGGKIVWCELAMIAQPAQQEDQGNAGDSESLQPAADRRAGGGRGLGGWRWSRSGSAPGPGAMECYRITLAG